MPSGGHETNGEVEESGNSDAQEQQALVTSGECPGALKFVQHQEITLKLSNAMRTLLDECRSKGASA